MKTTKTFILLVLIVGFMSINLLGCSNQEQDWDRDNYGKFICQIIDPETGGPVKEKFRLTFFDSKKDHMDSKGFKVEDTDKNGHVELELYPYVYFVHFFPDSRDSKYSISPYPYYVNDEERVTIKIEKGKITYLEKIADIGGILKIYTADLLGNKFYPQEKFDTPFLIRTSIDSSIYSSIPIRDDLNDGEMTIKRLCSGVYSIRVSFDGLGFSNIKKENILVEGGKTTEVLINIDPNDNTGIDGIVTDANGIPLEGLQIDFSLKEGISLGLFDTKTNKNGYYKLKGMPEGYYLMSYTYITKTESIETYNYKGIIKITKNVLTKFDLKLEYTTDELEGL